MPLADPIDRCIRSLDVVIALQIPDDSDRSHVVGPAQVQDLFNDLIRRLVGGLVRTAASAFQPLVTKFAISVSPFIERRS
jgi:hypothetical protein